MKNNTINFPNVSFIIPTLNASRMLPRCLSVIRSQKYPQKKVEIIVADGGSTDNTLSIAKKYHAKIIKNPEILHEHGKTRGSKIAKGSILFYTDADNILSDDMWLIKMTKPFIDDKSIMGFLPLTIPAPDTNTLDRYLGYLCTDPFTWFVYKNAASGKGFNKLYRPIKETEEYAVYQLPLIDPPMFGLSQGVGTNKRFNREGIGYADDILAGIKLIAEQGKIAYISKAGVYHYHVSGIKNFITKYSWRVKNNVSQKIKGMGLVNRRSYFSRYRNMRMYLFIPYGFSILLPFIDGVILSIKYKDKVMFWHIPTCFILSFIICYQTILHKMNRQTKLGKYE